MNTFFNLKLSSFLNKFSSVVFPNDTFSICNLVFARFQYIHFSVQNKFYAIHTNFLPAVLNSQSDCVKI